MTAYPDPASLISRLETLLSDCMLADRYPLRRRLQQARSALDQQKSIDTQLAEIAAGIHASSARLASRKAGLPKPEYPEELPVSGRKDEIAEAIAKHQVVIVSGETGSGKTTQLPKICLEIGRGIAGLIGHTQPRRIAARSVASRIAQELKSPLGQHVGYKVRFNDKLSESSYIKLMTDGILLAETQGDRFLNAYDTIIIDEAHERSLNIDFLLGYLKQLLPKRPDLKIIITSATINAERFSQHFNNAPVIEVSGRMYPVEIRYRPLQETDEDEQEETMESAIVDAVDDLSRLGGGDILVFLPGEREIRDTAEHLRKHHPKGAEILPLFARLSIEDQQKIFRPSGGRRIVLATNVAETSLTVPGIKYVIDTGLARVNRYSARNKVEQLQIEKISQAAAKQRAGRCGRVSNGICVRLYSEEDYNNRAEFTDPEILRSSLASVILRMAALKLGDVAEFPFIEAPSSRLIADGYQLLRELGAVDAKHQLTEIGSQLARLPLDPRIGRMILAGRKENCLKEILIIASALAIQDPRDRPMDKREAADQAHAQFADEKSDFLSFLKIWAWYEDALRHKKSNRDLLNKCHQYFLSFLRLKEWRELHGQIAGIVSEIWSSASGPVRQAKAAREANEQATQTVQIVRQGASKAGDKVMAKHHAQEEANYDQIHRALLSGLLGNVGFKDGEADSYLGARGIRFSIAPGSSLKKVRPKWVVAAELVETTKLYARVVAKIEPDWIEPLAKGLTESHYSDPRWDRKMAQVTAWERVSLYGLTIVPKRRVHYGPINPQEAREIFIREALANMEYDTRAPFFAANKKLIVEIEELEHKARRQDVLVDEHVLFGFYDARIPQGIFNGISFEKWRQEAEKANPRLLFLTREELMRHAAANITEELFPEQMQIGMISVPLKYRFEPGHALDGVTAIVPLHVLNQLNPAVTDWLVPGMIRDKVTHLVKALPKTIRRVCVPVPDFVTRFLEQAKPGEKPVREALAAFIAKETKLVVDIDEWNAEKLPDHLSMNFLVVDEAGQELATGRDWTALKAQLGQAAQLTFRANTPDIEREGLRQWDFGDLPESLTFSRDGSTLTGFPAVEDNGDSVAIRLYDTPEAAQEAHRAGVRRLMRFELNQQMKQLEKGLPGFTQYALLLRNIMSPDDLREDMMTAIADRAFIGDDPLPRSNDEFMKLKQRARTRLPAVTEAITRQALNIATEYQALTAKIAQPGGAARIKPEIEQQLRKLLFKGFFSQTPWEQLQHLPRYLKAMRMRMEKYPGNIDRDTKHAYSIIQLWQNWEAEVEKRRKAGRLTPDLMDYRWLIEELRVSLFAQELKTPFPVSYKRLEKAWSEL